MTTIFNSVIPDINLPEHNVKASSAKFVLLALADHAHDDGTHVYPSVTRLGLKTQLSRRTVIYALEALKSIGLIVNVGHSSWETINYRIAVDKINALPKWTVEKTKSAPNALSSQAEAPDAQVECTECMDTSASDAPESLFNHNNNHKGDPHYERNEVTSSKEKSKLSYRNNINQGRNMKINIFSEEEEDILQRFTEITGVYCPRDQKRLELAKFLLARVAEGDRIEDFSKWAMEYGQHKGDDFGKYMTWPEDLIADWGPAMKAGRKSREFACIYTRP